MLCQETRKVLSASGWYLDIWDSNHCIVIRFWHDKKPRSLSCVTCCPHNSGPTWSYHRDLSQTRIWIFRVFETTSSFGFWIDFFKNVYLRSEVLTTCLYGIWNLTLNSWKCKCVVTRLRPDRTDTARQSRSESLSVGNSASVREEPGDTRYRLVTPAHMNRQNTSLGTCPLAQERGTVPEGNYYNEGKCVRRILGASLCSYRLSYNGWHSTYKSLHWTGILLSSLPYRLTGWSY